MEENPIYIAIVDLDAGAIEKLIELGWLDKDGGASQMDVNEVCTELIRRALKAGLSRSGN